MRLWIALVLLVVSLPNEAFANPRWSDPLAELDASLAPAQLSTRALLAMELPRLVVSASPRIRHSVMDNPVMRALFKGVRMPTLNTLRAQEERIVMLAVRPRGAGGFLRFRVRFDSGLFEHSSPGPLRRFLLMRRPDV